MRTLITMLILAASITSAHASVYNYACHAPDDFKLHAAKIDTAKRTITWRGTVYKNLKTTIDDGSGEKCAKVCFEATGRDGVASLETATQGAATLSVSFWRGPGDDGINEFECDLVRQ
jgi:hypothetical protein